MSEKIKVVLGQLGSPRSASVKDVRTFLKEFLRDPRVVDINPIVWKIILNLFVLPFRPKKSAEAYSRIAAPEGFPLITTTVKVTDALRPMLDSNLEINHCFLLADPRPTAIFDEWEKEDVYTRAQKVLLLPQFPQYAESTIGSVVDVLGKDLGKRVNIPSLVVVNSYHRSSAFIDNSVRKIHESFKAHPGIDQLVISFHGIPLRRVLQKKDQYYQHCLETYELIRERLGIDIDIKMTFQSRFGSEVWLGPYTDATVEKMVKEGKKKIAVYCPSFVVDCLETTDEIGTELAHEVKELGAELIHVPCLNSDPEWIKDYAHFINTYANGSETERAQLFYPIELRELMTKELHEQAKAAPTPMPESSKKILKMMFLTMFLDLVGFSIIFPMFPAMAKYYLSVDSDNFFLSGMMNLISNVQSISLSADGTPQMSTVVLFGGLLGAIYSLLQFIAAPIWGGISDRIGRRPVLLISVFGLFLSYVVWFFSGSFTQLIIARLIGGLMSGNLSIASAVVSDVTDSKNRSRGMAVIGIAFALGFILGPAMGGILSMVNLTEIYPSLVSYGVNPFSSAALLAAVLSFINFFVIWRKFPETLKKGADSGHYKRTLNIISLFKPLPDRRVNLTNFSYFLFITFFSGMEFTLTFLAVERLGYTSMDNAYMFIFIGLVIGLVQGGYVRRKANLVGEKKMAFQGLVILAPGLVLLAIADAGWLLYGGLFFLAMGSAMVIPCLTSLVSLYSPAQIQGQSLGIFRSLGALGRVAGPIYASLMYWKFGAAVTYVFGAIAVLIPAMLVKTLPEPAKGEE